MYSYLFVGKNEKNCISEFIFLQHAVQFIAGLANTLSIIAVNDKNETLCILEVVSPQWTDLVLTSDIPDGEADVLVFDSLHIEANGWNCGHNLAQFELIQNGGFTGSVQTNHENSHVALAKQAAEERLKCAHSILISNDKKSFSKNNLIQVVSLHVKINSNYTI